MFFFVLLNQLVKGFNLSYQTKKKTKEIGRKISEDKKKSGSDTLTSGLVLIVEQTFVSSIKIENSKSPEVSPWVSFKLNQTSVISSVKGLENIQSLTIIKQYLYQIVFARKKGFEFCDLLAMIKQLFGRETTFSTIFVAKYSFFGTQM